MNNVKMREIVKASLSKHYRTAEGVFVTVGVILAHTGISSVAKYNVAEMFKSKFNINSFIDAIALNRILALRNKSYDSDFINMTAMHMLSDMIYDCFVEYRNLEEKF